MRPTAERTLRSFAFEFGDAKTASNTLIDDWFIGQASVVHRTEEAIGTTKVAGGYLPGST